MIARLAMMLLVLVSALLLSTVVFPLLAVDGIRPELIVLTVVAFALADGPGTGARYGFVAGLATDLLSGGSQIVGISALVMLGVGYVVGLVRPYLAGVTLVGEVAVAGAATIASMLAYGLLALLLETPFASGSLPRAMLGVGLYNTVLAPFVLRPVASLSRQFSGGPGGPMTLPLRSSSGA